MTDRCVRARPQLYLTLFVALVGGAVGSFERGWEEGVAVCLVLAAGLPPAVMIWDGLTTWVVAGGVVGAVGGTALAALLGWAGGLDFGEAAFTLELAVEALRIGVLFGTPLGAFAGGLLLALRRTTPLT